MFPFKRILMLMVSLTAIETPRHKSYLSEANNISIAVWTFEFMQMEVRNSGRKGWGETPPPSGNMESLWWWVKIVLEERKERWVAGDLLQLVAVKEGCSVTSYVVGSEDHILASRVRYLHPGNIPGSKPHLLYTCPSLQLKRKKRKERSYLVPEGTVTNQKERGIASATPTKGNGSQTNLAKPKGMGYVTYCGIGKEVTAGEDDILGTKTHQDPSQSLIWP